MRNSTMAEILRNEMIRLNGAYHYRDRAQDVLDKENDKVDQLSESLKAMLSDHHVVYQNASRLSRAVSEIKVAYLSTDNIVMQRQYLANIRYIIGLMSPKSNALSIANIYENSNIWKQTGVPIEVFGLDAIALMIRGHTLIDISSDAKVRIINGVINYRFSSVGAYNKTPTSMTPDETLQEFSRRRFHLSTDMSNENSIGYNDDTATGLLMLSTLSENEVLRVDIAKTNGNTVPCLLKWGWDGLRIAVINPKHPDISYIHSGDIYHHDGSLAKFPIVDKKVVDIIKVINDSDFQVVELSPLPDDSF